MTRLEMCRQFLETRDACTRMPTAPLLANDVESDQPNVEQLLEQLGRSGQELHRRAFRNLGALVRIVAACGDGAQPLDFLPAGLSPFARQTRFPTAYGTVAVA